jgi:hypothetical protein
LWMFYVSFPLYFSLQPIQASVVRPWKFGKFSLPHSSWHIYLLQKLCTLHIISLLKWSISCLSIHGIYSCTMQRLVRHLQQINTKWIWIVCLLHVNISQTLRDVIPVLVMKDMLLLPCYFCLSSP